MIRRFLRRFLPARFPKTLPSLDAYSYWAEGYPPHAHNSLMQVEEEAMLSLMPALKNRMVLDLACGTGRYGLIALEQGAPFVVGLDNSAAMLRVARIGRVALASTEAIPLGAGSVDVIICGLALGHLPHLNVTLREISRVLTPGGYALVSDLHPLLALSGAQRTFTTPDGQTFAVEHHIHLNADYNRSALEAGLKIEQVVEPRLDVKNAPGKTQSDVPVVIVFRFQKPT